MRIVGIVQARMGSTRLPGKVLRPLAGRTVLGRVVRAAHESAVLDDLVVASTTEQADDAVEAEAQRLGVACHRGPVDDVLTRFLGALDEHPADAVMRFTADCPLIDPDIVSQAATVWRAVPGLDYLSTAISRCLPRGLDIEIVSAQTLRGIDAVATEHHRTHVTSYVYSHPQQYRVLGLTLPPDLSHLRLTLDTADDWRLIEAVVAHFGDTSVSLRKLAEWLAANPEVGRLNAHVQQKRIEDA
ncbi:MAG TPA: glycosyltransferase family protein [Micromonosporaceae bacterium]|nr:glycosyltransferase family protein [Micromonosporaceae bacterium]